MKVFRLTAAIGLLAGSLVLAEDEAAYVEPPITDRDRSHWSFRPIESPDVPAIGDIASDASHPIDGFLLAALRENGIDDFAPQAAPEILLRRLTFDLTGLPPTPEQRGSFLESWQTDPAAAISETIDSLLESPHYGERWAQHWLDIARFAETDGFEHDKVRENAWRYRDWVIRALNNDLPYDRFVALQIAGDELEPDEPDAHLATGFLLSGPDMPDINLESERRHNVLNEMTGTVGSVFLGVSLECAQCHDHKSDPVSQADFYRLRAFFDNTALPKKNKSLPHLISEPGPEPSVASRLMIRGDFRRPGLELQPAVLRVAQSTNFKMPAIKPKEKSTGRRAALAKWLTHPENPLTWRVAANRIWQHHFDRALVTTPSDFGKTGDRPTHPKLLDSLASELIRRGGSLKAMHRLILTSRAWQQASSGDGSESWQQRLVIDPQNRLVSRQNRRRLSGEALRDTMLLASGKLNRKAGGPGVRPPLPPEVTVTLLKNQWPVTEDEAEHDRRSIYLFVRRNLRYPMFDVFDRPDGNRSCARRHVSTTAPQSLTLLNDPFVHEMAATLARRIETGDPDAAIENAFQLAIGRSPTLEEIQLGREFLAPQSLEQFCLALFNLNEFVYLD